MRLLVTGGSGFLGGYVLDEAARRGHSCVALARSPAAARTVAARGATPLTGDLDDRVRARRRLRGRAAATRCQPGVARLRARARDRRRRPLARGLDRAVFVSTTAVTTALPARSKAVRLAAEQAIRCLRTEVDDPAADHDLRRARRPEPVPAAHAARAGGRACRWRLPTAGAAGARRRRPAPAARARG